MAFVLLTAIILLFSAATHTEVVNAAINPLLPICKTVGGGSMYVGIDFCMSALGSDSRSSGDQTYRTLSLVAVDLLTANVTSTAAKIDGLLRAGGGGKDGDALRSCQALYKGVAERQPGCGGAVKAGKFKEAQSSLEESASAIKECEAGFAKRNVASPLTVEGDNAFELAKLAVALLNFAV
ncbi:hypothetical protein EJB05_57396, partial [Eragrostis curvula]